MHTLILIIVKNVLNNSSYQHLIRRDLDEESFEFIAERLLTTKSNSSAKMKEIENMTFSKERMRNIFCEDCRKTISGMFSLYMNLLTFYTKHLNVILLD